VSKSRPFARFKRQRRAMAATTHHSPTKPCIACRAPIPFDASICAGCKSHQASWKNRLQFWASVTALIVVGAGVLSYGGEVGARVVRSWLWGNRIAVETFCSHGISYFKNDGASDVLLTGADMTMDINRDGSHYLIQQSKSINEQVKAGQTVGVPTKLAAAIAGPVNLQEFFRTFREKGVEGMHEAGYKLVFFNKHHPELTAIRSHEETFPGTVTINYLPIGAGRGASVSFDCGVVIRKEIE
jgi:hypothetical protein